MCDEAHANRILATEGTETVRLKADTTYDYEMRSRVPR